MRMIGLVVAIAVMSSVAVAYEIEGNPDRMPSVGLNYTGSFLKGDITYDSIRWNQTPEYKQDTNTILTDVRLPVSSNLTIEVGAGYVKQKIQSIDGSLISLSPIIAIRDTTNTDLTGPVVKLGARVYFK